jgi:transposase InsO family protein
MLTEEEFEAWCHLNQLSETARQIITDIRSSNPVRPVGSRAGNVSGNYCSEKMGNTIQFESHRGELAHIMDRLEHDKRVLEFYDQPSKIELNYLSKNGRKVRTTHTPDFFVMERNWAGWEEFKTIEELERKVEEQPNRYQQDEEGNWYCPPGEESAGKYGLGYRVCSSAELNPRRLRNWIWLEPYFQSSPPSFKDSIFQTILTRVKESPGITYAQLLLSVEGIEPDHLNWLIAYEQIFINFNEAPLAEPDHIRVYLTQELATSPLSSVTMIPNGFHSLQVEVGTRLSWDGQYWEISNVGIEQIYLTSEKGKIISLLNAEFNSLFQKGTITALDTSIEPLQDTTIKEILAHARPKDHEIATERYEAILPYLEGTKKSITKADRSIRRWYDSYRQGEELYGDYYAFIELFPRHFEKGGHKKLDPTLVEFMDNYIDEHYFSAKNRKISGVYRSFRVACQEHNPPFEPPSEKTFRFRIKHRRNEKNIEARSGSRIAKQSKAFHNTKGIPRNGELPWESAHIDHTEFDIELKSSLISLVTCNSSSAIPSDDKGLGRCWATFMVDSYSKRILACYLSFEPPSYRSCMMVIRACVRRFNRLPQTIITDNGREFHSTYFKTLLACYKCHHKYRPSGEPRYGHPVERVFGTTNTLWIHELRGNTQIKRQHRQVTKAVNPANQAVWTIGELYQRLENWVYEIYDKREHSSLGQSPHQAYETGIALGGKREMRRIDYDDIFKILTLPGPGHGGTRVVQPNRGIKIHIIYYFCAEFNHPELHGKKVPVKIDPFDVSHAYAYVNGRWRECISDYYQFLKGRTEKEIQIISADLRQRKSDHGKRVEISDRELVEALNSAEIRENELIQKQQIQARENQTVVNHIDETESELESSQTNIDAPVADHYEQSLNPNPKPNHRRVESYGEF